MAGRGWLQPLLLAALTATSVPERVDDETSPTHRPGEFLIGFTDSTSDLESKRLLDALGVETIKRIGKRPIRHARLGGATLDEVVRRIGDDPRVEFIEPNYLLSIQGTPDDPDFDRLWGLENTGQNGGTPGADTDAVRAWDVTTGSGDVIVAILDTGTDYEHVDLAGNLWVNPDEVPDNGVDDDGNGYVDDVHGWDFVNHDNRPLDDHGHGTHVAGTVGAVGDNGVGLTGVSWQVGLMPLKFLDSDGIGDTAAAVAAIDYAIDNGARVINASWGRGSYSVALRRAVEHAAERGVLFVAAAGNSLPGKDNDQIPFFPASYELPNVISVAATGGDDELGSFSNYGAQSVDLAAPGKDVFSTYPRNGYAFLNGTSMATPHVCGALALVISRFPGIAAPEARALVLDNVDRLASLEGRTRTGGRLNLYRPLADAEDTAPDPIDDLQALEPESARIDLVWTATGDDGRQGTAARYDVRYATYPLDDRTFASGAPATDVPRPSVAGSRERMRILDLQAETTYWFAIQVLDEFGNRSPISNVVALSTAGPPEIRVAPAALQAELPTGGQARQLLVVDNLGAGELVLTVDVERADEGAKSGRPSPGPRIGHASRAADPDVSRSPRESQADGWRVTGAGRREVTDETAANGTRFSYHERDSLGGHYSGIYRQLTEQHPAYVRFHVRPGSTEHDDAYFVLREPRGQAAILFYAAASGRFHVNAAVGGNEAVDYEPERWYKIEFRDVDYSRGLFDYYVDDVRIQEGIPFRAPSTSGLGRVDLYNFDTGAAAWWDEIVVSPTTPASPVQIEPQSAVVAAGGRLEVAVDFNAADLLGGRHPFRVVLTSNDPLQPRIVVDANLDVTDAPDLTVSDEAVDFGELFVGGTAPRQIELRNTGRETLEVSSVVAEGAEFQVDTVALSLEPSASRTIEVRYLPGATGPSAGVLAIASNDPDRPRLEIPLVGVGQPPPGIRIEPASLMAELLTGEAVETGVVIDNPGQSELVWELTFPGVGGPPIEWVRDALADAGASLAATIPSRFGFNGGDVGIRIASGGDGMFNGGNILSTDLGGYVEYTNGTLGSSPLFGPGGRYFTAKYPGLFLLAANLSGVDTFTIVGNVGGDGFGRVDSSTVRCRANGVDYVGWIKRVWGAGTPSVNHLIVLEDRPGVEQQISDNPHQDFHRMLNLAGHSRLYYLMFGGKDGVYIDDDEMRAFLDRFLTSLRFAPDWVETAATGGRLAPGDRTELSVHLSADGLVEGHYATVLRILSNVPDGPAVEVPVSLSVQGAPDIAVAEEEIDFGATYTDAPVTRTIEIENTGVRYLTVHVDLSHPDFEASPAGLFVAPRSRESLRLRFTPSSAGDRSETLILRSNDPDEPEVTVELRGRGVAPPQIHVDPTELSVELAPGETLEREVVVTNVSGSDLVFFTTIEYGSGAAFDSAVQQSQAVPDEHGSPRGTAPGPMPPAPVDTLPPPPPPPAPPVPFLGDDFEDGDFDGWSISGGAESAMRALEVPVGPAEQASAKADPVKPPGRPPDAGRPPIASEPPALSTGAVTERPSFHAAPFSATVRGGESRVVTVTFNVGDVHAGSYHARLRIDSNDPAQSRIDVPLTVKVIGDADMGTSIRSLDFGPTRVGTIAVGSLTVTNFGNALLDVHRIRAEPADFTVNRTALQLEPGRSHALVLTFRPTTTGPVEGTLTLASNDPGAEEVRIPLSGEGRAPRLLASAGALAIEQFRGQQTVRTLTVTNEGDERLEYAISARDLDGQAIPERTERWHDDVEGEAPGWHTDVFAGADLWHRTSSRAKSAAASWWCGVADRGSYDTGERVSTSLLSPPIDLREAEPPIHLTFFEAFDTEPGRDQCLVDVSTDDGESWSHLRGPYGEAPSGSTDGWVETTLDLSAHAGEIVRLRFHFETGDDASNDFAGWFLDDLRVSSRGAPWISVFPDQGQLAPQTSVDVRVALDADRSHAPGTSEGLLRIDSNDPFQPRLDVAVRMRVTPAPVLALPGETVRLRSASSAASSPTRHRFDSAPPPGDGGSLTVEAEGDFDAPGETARVTAEALALGSAGGSGVECGTAARQFGISLEELRALTADGTIQIGVRNSSAVEPGCPVHEHRVTLEYRRAIDRVDFGELAPGERSTRTIRLGNAGAGPLELASLATDDERVRVEASSLVIDPGATADVTLDWEPDRPGELAALLAIVSNDPDLPLVTISLTGSAALAPARAVVAPVELVAALPPRSDRTRTKSLVLTNPGGRPLDWEVEPLDGVTTVPAGGRLPAGDSVELGVRFSSRALGEGEHRRTLVLRTSDPDRPEIAVPTVLYAREVELDRMSVDFTPRHAEREGTVEVALQLPQPLDPREIRLASVTLSGVAADLLPIHYLDTDGDHVPELVLQFDRAALERYLATADELSVTVTGEVRDVTWFTGTQHLRGVADLRR